VKVFFDTNVLVAAFATRGLCADLFAHVLLEHERIVGEVVLDELRETLRTRIEFPKKSIDEIEALLREATVVEKPRKHLGLNVKDPDDEWIVASAVAGAADVLVTGDAAVLRIAARSPLKIASPRGFWDLLRGPARERRPSVRPADHLRKRAVPAPSPRRRPRPRAVISTDPCHPEATRHPPGPSPRGSPASST